MNSSYRILSDDLTPDFINILKASYPHKEIEIIVDEVMDETEYLTKSPANKLHLDSAIKNIENHIEIVEVSLESIKS